MQKSDETSMLRGVRVTESPGTVIDMASLEKEKQGIKFDTGKLRWELLPWSEVSQVVKILTFGAKNIILIIGSMLIIEKNDTLQQQCDIL
jgi:hypothetical protein